VHARCLAYLGSEEAALDALAAVFATEQNIRDDAHVLAVLADATARHCLAIAGAALPEDDVAASCRRALDASRHREDAASGNTIVLLQKRDLLLWSLARCAQVDLPLAVLAAGAFLDDRAVDDLAAHVGLSEAAVRERLQTFVARLREDLQRHAPDHVVVVDEAWPDKPREPAVVGGKLVVVLPSVSFEADDVRSSNSLFQLERLAVGELPAAESARVQTVLRDDPTLAEIYSEVVAADRTFLLLHPPATFRARLAAHAAQRATGLRRVVATTRVLVRGPLIAAAAAASVALFVAIQSVDDVGAPVTGHDPESASAAGSLSPASLSFVVSEREGQTRVGHDGEALGVGAQVEIRAVDPPSSSWIAFAVDDRGRIHDIAAGPVPAYDPALPRRTPRRLVPSMTLHDGVGVERFFVVWGNDPDSLRARARAAADELAARIRAGVDVAALPTLPLAAAAMPQASFVVATRR
jgi:hypothetical protein